jgi:hypothetical protein
MKIKAFYSTILYSSILSTAHAVFLGITAGLLCSSVSITATNSATSLIMGAMQFPATVQQVPYVRIYFCGKKLPAHLCEADHDSKQFTFRVPHMMHTNKIYMLITPEIRFKTHKAKHPDFQGNVIDYLRVPKAQPYKFYELVLVEDKIPESVTEFGNKSEKSSAARKNKKNRTASWAIKSMSLDKNTRQIPDDTIIVCYDPACVDFLSGGSAFELPTITLKSDLLALLGSEDILQNLSNKMLLSSIDSDTVHASIAQNVKHTRHATLIAPA